MIGAKEKFKALRQQAMWLRICYNMHQQLYDSGLETLEVLKNTANTFFSDLSHVLSDYVVIQITRLTDHAESRGRQNLTINNLNEALLSEHLMTTEIDALAQRLNSYGNLLRDGRHKIIAHADLHSIMNHQVFGAHDKQDQLQFFDDLQDYFDQVGTAVGFGPADFRTMAGEGDVLDLISVLSKSLKGKD